MLCTIRVLTPRSKENRRTSISRPSALVCLIAVLTSACTGTVLAQVSPARDEAKGIALEALERAAESVEKLESGIAEGKLQRQTQKREQGETVTQADILVAFTGASRRSDYVEVENRSNAAFGALARRYAVNETAEYLLETRGPDLNPPGTPLIKDNPDDEGAKWSLQDVNIRRMMQPYDFEFRSIVEGIKNGSVLLNSAVQDEDDGTFRIDYRYYGDDNYTVILDLFPREGGLYLSSEKLVLRGIPQVEIGREYIQIDGAIVPKKIEYVNRIPGEDAREPELFDRAGLDLTFSKVNQKISPDVFTVRGFDLLPSTWLLDASTGSRGSLVRLGSSSDLQSETGR